MHRSKLTCNLLILAASVAAFGQNQSPVRPAVSYAQSSPGYAYTGMRTVNDDLRSANFGHYPGSPADSPFAAPGQSTTALNQLMRQAQAEGQNGSSYADYMERQRALAAAARAEAHRLQAARLAALEPQAHADPEAPDQSELLRNSKDRDFILRNFRTMYVDARDAQYFGADQMKAALGRNKEFAPLNVRIVDDPRVADVVLKVSYTFAWDYPFELRHQNTTIVLLAGKGEGPFSGPLGAADVAREFVNVTKPWREEKGKSNH
jgi:hypothetical protein